MSRPTVSPPPFWLRLSVVIGACALVMGLVGAVILLVNDDAEAPSYGVGLCPRLKVAGLPGEWPIDVTVNVAWREESEAGEAIDIFQTALPLAGSPGTFLLPPGACDHQVVLEIIDTRQDPPTPLARREVDVRRGEEVSLDVSD